MNYLIGSLLGLFLLGCVAVGAINAPTPTPGEAATVAALIIGTCVLLLGNPAHVCLYGGTAGMELRADGVLVRHIPSKNTDVTRHNRFAAWSEVAAVRIEEVPATRGLGPPVPQYFLVLHLTNGDLVRTVGVAVRKQMDEHLLHPAYDRVQAARRATLAGTPHAEPEQSAAERAFRRKADLKGIDLEHGSEDNLFRRIAERHGIDLDDDDPKPEQ